MNFINENSDEMFSNVLLFDTKKKKEKIAIIEIECLLCLLSSDVQWSGEYIIWNGLCS